MVDGSRPGACRLHQSINLYRYSPSSTAAVLSSDCSRHLSLTTGPSISPALETRGALPRLAPAAQVAGEVTLTLSETYSGTGRAAHFCALRLLRPGRPPPKGLLSAKSMCFWLSTRTRNEGTFTICLPTLRTPSASLSPPPLAAACGPTQCSCLAKPPCSRHPLLFTSIPSSGWLPLLCLPVTSPQ